MAPKHGIKETMDFIDAIEAAVIALDVANDDGKIDLQDLPKLAPVFLKLWDAVRGMAEIPTELNDLDAEEAKIIAQKSVDTFITMARLIFQEKMPS